MLSVGHPEGSLQAVLRAQRQAVRAQIHIKLACLYNPPSIIVVVVVATTNASWRVEGQLSGLHSKGDLLCLTTGEENLPEAIQLPLVRHDAGQGIAYVQLHDLSASDGPGVL